jgi:hypothetical protein
MRGGNRIAAAVLGLLALAPAGCAPGRDAAASLPRIEVGVAFQLENLCTGSLSPPIALGDLPAGTARLAVRMTNIGVLRQTPRDWTVAAPSQTPPRIPAGALDAYDGPCPGDLQRPIYRVEVLAQSRDGIALGHGFREVRILPVNRMAQERWARGERPPDDAFTRSDGFFGIRELHLRERDVEPFETRQGQGRDSVFAPAGSPASRDPAAAR